jgi:hypothetical protein
VNTPSFVQQIRAFPERFTGFVRRESGTAPRTAAEFLEETRNLAAGLAGYGFGPGERAAVLGRFGADALEGIFAVWTAGGTALPVDASVPIPEIRDALRAARVQIALAVGRSDLDRLLLVRPDLPDLEIVFVAESGGGDRPSPARTFAEVAASGAAVLRATPDRLSDLPVVSTVMVLGGSPEGLGTRRRGPDDLDRGAEDLAARFGFDSGDRVLVSLPFEGGGDLDVARAVLERGGEIMFAESDLPDPKVYRAAGPTRAFVRGAGLSLLERAVDEAIGGRGFFGRAVLRRAFRMVENRSRHPRAAGLADRFVLREFGSRLTGGHLRTVACPSPLPSTPRLAALGVSTRAIEGAA